MTINIEIERITVLTGSGTDTILIKPKNLTPTMPAISNDAIIRIDTAAGFGKTWLTMNFGEGCDAKIINV